MDHEGGGDAVKVKDFSVTPSKPWDPRGFFVNMRLYCGSTSSGQDRNKTFQLDIETAKALGNALSYVECDLE